MHYHICYHGSRPRQIYRRLRDGDVKFETVLAEREAWERHKIIKTLTITWLYAIIVMFPPLVGWGSFAFESGGAICAPNWRENSDAGRAYLLVLVMLAFVIPLGVSIVCFIRIYWRSKQTICVNLMMEKDRRKAMKAVMMVLVGIISFVLSWTPYCVCAMISVFGGSEMFDREKSFIPGIFAKASTVYNPLICMLVSKRFRTVALALFHLNRKRQDFTTDAVINADPVAVTLCTPSDELSMKRSMCSYHTTLSACRLSKPLLKEDALNRQAPKETSV
ncbi:hypothetical protein OS493_032430 [Desmophyllum pertusum]|uniref:G-protein coupled receptors family 1 profile domain-containing protein n=1 Tax=Desmophyllum pertusum TaxID=174260 RepID=A0A9W9ZYB7_9CNID|nr:hypothetical protein OS493_032430 [Desmophyllum pertusum]